MLRRAFFRWLAMACGAFVAACGEQARKFVQPVARFAKQGGWDDWNERKYQRDLRQHGPGVYCYELEEDGKYGDLTHTYPDMIGGRGRVGLPADVVYAVRVPADSYPKAA